MQMWACLTRLTCTLGTLAMQSPQSYAWAHQLGLLARDGAVHRAPSNTPRAALGIPFWLA